MGNSVSDWYKNGNCLRDKVSVYPKLSSPACVAKSRLISISKSLSIFIWQTRDDENRQNPCKQSQIRAVLDQSVDRSFNYPPISRDAHDMTVIFHAAWVTFALVVPTFDSSIALTCV